MTQAKVKPVQDGMHTVTPHLVCAGASKAIEFYVKAFGAIDIAQLPGPEGRLMHGMIRIGDSFIMLMDEYPECGAKAPTTLKGTPVTIHLSVPDVDALFERAVAAGATAKMPPSDMFWGDRYGVVEDPFGHSWSMATHVRDMTAKEIREASKTACA